MTIKRPMIERALDMVSPEPNTGCWLWAGEVSGGGYGRIYCGERKKSVSAHRVTYEHFVGEIPAGLQIDHLCRVRSCVNPAHLEPVTNAENQKRRYAATSPKKRCKHGHLLAGNNVVFRRRDNGIVRDCRECNRNRCAKYMKRLRASAWRPINTAPPHGFVLLWDGTQIYLAEKTEWGWHQRPTGEYENDAIEVVDPTHWMPLPGGPE